MPGRCGGGDRRVGQEGQEIEQSQAPISEVAQHEWLVMLASEDSQPKKILKVTP